MKRRIRPAQGNVYLLLALTIGMLLVVALGLFQFQMFLLRWQRAHSAAQACALEAANQLSKIVIEDSEWGYLSLSDYPACGSATLAADGEPLPVVGINSAIATVRGEKLLAKSLNNTRLDAEADRDYEQLQTTAASLQNALVVAVKPKAKGNIKFKDIDGKAVEVYEKARKMFEDNYPEMANGQARLAKLTLSLGWLEGGSLTITPDPERKDVVVESNEDYYTSFNNLPVEQKDFYFAGVTSSPALIEPNRFRLPDERRFCSAVRVDAQIDYLFTPPKGEKTIAHSVLVGAVALPPAQPNFGAGGALVVTRPQGSLRRFDCLANLLDVVEFDQFPTDHQSAEGGDFPVDPGSYLVNSPEREKHTVSGAVTKALFSWLRTNRGRSTLASITDAMTAPLDSLSSVSALALFDFSKQGECRVTRLANQGFGQQSISHRQILDVAYNVMPTEKGMLSVIIRNQVSRLSITDGGKHGGQPLLAQLPFDYSLPDFEAIAIEEEKIRLRKNKSSGLQTMTSVSQNKDDLPRSFRRSYLKGGLAVSLELSAVQICAN